MRFDGETYEPQHDEKRLSGQALKVFSCMADGKWRTLSEIASVIGGSETGISARLRDLRKKQFGEYVVHLRRKGDPARGIWEYQLVTKDNSLGFKWAANGQSAFL